MCIVGVSLCIYMCTYECECMYALIRLMCSVYLALPQCSIFSDPLVESDVWMEEDLDSLMHGFSTKTDSPVYTRKIVDPLGVSIESRNKQKLSNQELSELVPNGMPISAVSS